MTHRTRREVLNATALALVAAPMAARAAVIKGALPWLQERTQPPPVVDPSGWQYFTVDEAEAVEALVNRLIPPEPETPGGKEAGCAVFIDRQLAGPYGKFDGLYTSGPFHDGTEQQDPQSATTPAEHYRAAIAALDRHCRKTYGDKPFTQRWRSAPTCRLSIR